MDTFMDKLAHKLTAQEMIKANSAAEAEELKRLRSQVKEFNDCLAQMKQANDELRVQIQGLVEDGVAKLESAKVDGAEIDRLVEESIAKIQEIQPDTQQIQELQELKQTMNEKLEESGENIHKECVKVYRNVQAVVVEESGKQAEAVSTAVTGMKSKLNAILGVSIVALIAGLGGIVFQLLIFLHII